MSIFLRMLRRDGFSSQSSPAEPIDSGEAAGMLSLAVSHQASFLHGGKASHTTPQSNLRLLIIASQHSSILWCLGSVSRSYRSRKTDLTHNYNAKSRVKKKRNSRCPGSSLSGKSRFCAESAPDRALSILHSSGRS